MASAESAIPPFRADGYLPEGIHLALESEVLFRFGTSTRRRQKLALRLRRWILLARETRCPRLLVDGSFVTAKPNPGDIDAVILIPPTFQQQIDQGQPQALELEEMLLTRQPEEIFAAEDQSDWNAWIEFFSRTRERDGQRKGLVEVAL